jgi:hypothetical protein
LSPKQNPNSIIAAKLNNKESANKENFSTISVTKTENGMLQKLQNILF